MEPKRIREQALVLKKASQQSSAALDKRFLRDSFDLIAALAEQVERQSNELRQLRERETDLFPDVLASPEGHEAPPVGDAEPEAMTPSSMVVPPNGEALEPE